MSISAAEFLKWLEVFNITSGGGGGNTPGLYSAQAASVINYSTFVYNNGSSGIGATLTNSLVGVVAVDNIQALVGKIYLFKDQSNPIQNGLYVCTTNGSGVQAVFTRATYYDQPAQIKVGDLVSVVGGNTLSGTSWIQTQDVTTIGSDPIQFVESSAALVTLTGDVTGSGVGTIPTTLSTVNASPGTLDDPASTLKLTINGKGLVTNSSLVGIQIDESQVNNLPTDLAAKLNLAGGTMTGNLILNGDPTFNLQAVTKQYVDASIPGVSTAYGSIWIQNLSTVISYTDATTWKAMPGTILSNTLFDFTADNVTSGDPTTPFYLQYTGLTSGIFALVSTNSLRRFSSTAQNSYYFSIGNTVSTPISGTFGDRQLPFGLNGQNTQNSVDIPFVTVISLNPGDKIFHLIRNNGTTVTTDNDFLNTQQGLTIFKLQPTGATSAGVSSLDGLTGPLTMGSTNNTMIVTADDPVGGNINFKVTLPVSNVAQMITALSGVSAVSSSASLLDATTPDANGMVTCTAQFTATSDNSGALMKFKIMPPLSVTFSSASQAMPISCKVTPTALLGSAGALGSGDINQLFADTTNQWIEADIEVAQLNTDYTIWLTFKYQI